MRKYILSDFKNQLILVNANNILSYYRYTYQEGNYNGSKDEMKDVHIIDQFGYRYFIKDKM